MTSLFAKLFRPVPIAQFAKEVGVCVLSAYPPSLEGDDRPSTKKKLGYAALELDRRLEEFRLVHRVGFIRKARLANAIRWELKELGYSERFVDDMAKHVVVRLMRSATNTPKG